MAAYRHEDGRLTAVSPTCTNPGCQVTWNSAERNETTPATGRASRPTEASGTGRRSTGWSASRCREPGPISTETAHVAAPLHEDTLERPRMSDALERAERTAPAGLLARLGV